MDIVQIKLSDLKRPKRNVRMHSKKQIDEYCRSVKKYGQIRPMVVDEDYTILVGNGLYDALLELKWETGACIVKDGLSDHEKKKLMLADNRIFSLGVDDMSAFDEIISELAGDFDIPGYDDNLLNSLIAQTEDVDSIMSGYGLISENEKENMQRAEVSYGKQEEEFAKTSEEYRPVYEPLQQTDDDSPAKAVPEPVGGSDKLTHTADETPTEVRPEPLQRRFIVCPKCGEKIWI